MFKPGDVAVHRGQRRGIVTILPGTPPAGTHHKWPVLTSDGVVDEIHLFHGHPTVLATIGITVDKDGVIRTVEPSDEHEKFRARVRAKSKGELGELSDELREKVEKVLAKASLDLNGHWKNGSVLHERHKALKHLFLSAYLMPQADAEALVRASTSGTPLDRWLPVDLSMSLTGLHACSFCGEDEFTTETNGLVVRLAGEPCQFPNGLPPTEWELNVPSGKLVVANDLRELFPLPEDEDFDINTTLGCRQTALAYAANGMAHAFVGNSCPGVYQCGEGLFKIANEPASEEGSPGFEGEHVASICTDLWWYSICDAAEFERRCKRFKQKAKDFRIETVAVKPGVYRFRHDEEARGYDGPGECCYTRFEWVRKPDPVQNFLAKYEEADVNAHAYVHAQVGRWPTLYGRTVNAESWQRVADQVFCTIGGGVEWHEKGFPKAKIDPSIPDVEPPSFRAQYPWYPFSKPYGGLFEPKTLAPSFAKVAFRVLESVISFGTTVRDDAHSRDVRHVRDRMLVAVKRYRELAKEHPTLADPEYVAWLSQRGRAEAWVENFPLGPEFTDKHRKNAEAQRWVPEDAYAVAFDARKLKDGGHFAWHPKKGGCWAAKKDAQRYAIEAHEDNGQPEGHNCFWTPHATNTSVPLYFVARVVKVGEVSHMGATLVELAFDYGTPWMRNAKKRKAISEAGEKVAIKVLSKKEYEKLLPEAIEFYEAAEKAVRKDRDDA